MWIGFVGKLTSSDQADGGRERKALKRREIVNPNLIFIF